MLFLTSPVSAVLTSKRALTDLCCDYIALHITNDCGLDLSITDTISALAKLASAAKQRNYIDSIIPGKRNSISVEKDIRENHKGAI